MRYLTLIAALFALACGDESGTPVDDGVLRTDAEIAEWQALQRAQHDRCAALPLKIENTDQEFVIQLGHQGGAHIDVTMNVTGIPTRKMLNFDVTLDGEWQVGIGNQLYYPGEPEGCQVVRRIVLNDDSAYWDVHYSGAEYEVGVDLVVETPEGEKSFSWQRRAATEG